MSTAKFDRILSDLLVKHGAFQIPDFHFRGQAIRERPYREFVDELLTHFFAKDSTDLNRDGCFVYSILGDSRPQWMVQLSMVERYGVIFRIEGPENSSLYESSTDVTAKEAVILKLIKKHQIVLLDEETLMTPVTLTLDYTDPENVCLYQALFSDTDTLPWRPPIT